MQSMGKKNKDANWSREESSHPFPLKAAGFPKQETDTRHLQMEKLCTSTINQPYPQWTIRLSGSVRISYSQQTA